MLLQTKSTSDLISGIKCRDADCLASFYDYYSTLLFSIICRDIKENEDAERLLEDVLCKITCSISLYESRERFFTWVILLTRKEIQKFQSVKAERQKKIDAVIANLFFMQQPAAVAYTAS